MTNEPAESNDSVRVKRESVTPNEDDLVYVKRKYLAGLLEFAYEGAAAANEGNGWCHCCRNPECPDCQAFEAIEILVKPDPMWGFIADPLIHQPLTDAERTHRRVVHGKHYEVGENE